MNPIDAQANEKANGNFERKNWSIKLTMKLMIGDGVRRRRGRKNCRSHKSKKKRVVNGIQITL
jgi:hypothetical protein